ncbi:MAG TPA: RDD family protein [Candidatus Saccharimonadales bacterium]|nr:RDD family protein [Candidatus Saccharimonadales bacterium]
MAIGNDLTVAEGESASSVVVIGGSAVIEGKVTEDVVVIMGSVRLGEKAEIRRNLVVVGGKLDLTPGAKVARTRFVFGGNDQDFKRAAWLRWPAQWLDKALWYGRPLAHQYSWNWIVAAVALLVYAGLAVLFPRQVQAAVGSLEERPGAALAAGLLALVLLLPVMVLLVITVVGCLAVPFVIVGFEVAFLLGRVAVYRYAGQQIGAQLGLGILQRPLVALLAGGVLFTLIYAIPAVGFLAWIVLGPLGIGAVLLASFGRSRAPAARSATPATPGSEVPGSEGPPAAAASGVPAAQVLLPRAGFWARSLASLLDLLLVGFVVSLVFHRPRWFLLLWVVYLLVFWTWRESTIGGLLCGLKLARLDGRPMNSAVALVRLFGSFLSLAAFGLGFLWAAWSPEKQSWHDTIAGTVMVKAPRRLLAAG